MRIQVKGDTLDEAINNAMTELLTTSDNIAYDVIQEGSTGFLGIGSRKYIIEAYKKDDKEEIYKKESVDKKDKLIENEKGVYEFKSSKPAPTNKTHNKNNEHNVTANTEQTPNKTYVKKEEKMTRNPEEVYNKAKEFLTHIFKEFNTDINIDYTANIDTNTVVLNITGDKMGVIIGKHGQTLDAMQHLLNIIINSGETDRVKVRIDSENYRDKRNKTLETLAKSVANNVRKTHKDYELEPMSSYERRIIHSVLQKERNIETASIGFDNERHVVVKYRRYKEVQ